MVASLVLKTGSHFSARCLPRPSPIAVEQQLPQDRRDLAVDHPGDVFGPPAPFERLDRLGLIGDVVAEPFQREEERAFVVERIARRKALRTRQAQLVLRRHRSNVLRRNSLMPAMKNGANGEAGKEEQPILIWLLLGPNLWREHNLPGALRLRREEQRER